MSKELKQEFLEIKSKTEKPSWIKYLNGRISDVMKIDNVYLTFEKPSIKTNFCFGAGMNGGCTEEEWKDAHDSEKYARTEQSYFINENLQGINEEIDLLELYINSDDDYDFYKKYRGYGATLKPILYVHYDKLEASYGFYSDEDIKKGYVRGVVKTLTREDLKPVLENLKAEKEKFIKRLNTYLKKYGLSKLHTWTYICD